MSISPFLLLAASLAASAGSPVKSPLTKADADLIMAGRQGQNPKFFPIAVSMLNSLGLSPAQLSPNRTLSVNDCPTRSHIAPVYDEHYMCRYRETGDYLFLSTHDPHYYYIRADSAFQFIAGSINRTGRKNGAKQMENESLLEKEGAALLANDLANWTLEAARLRAAQP